MEQLKATTAQEIVRKEKDCDYMDELFGGVKMPPTQVYIKSEADKYIALLKDKANYNECAYKLKSEELADSCRLYEDGLRRQKYKRCLAMYRYCAIKALYALGCKGNEVEWKWYSKWMHEWYKLAKKFKEAMK